MTKFPIIDLHTDFILGEAGLGKKIFGIDMKKQISKSKAEKAGVKTLLAGFSYDDEQGCTETMLSAMEDFSKNKKSKFNIIFHIEGAGILAKNPKLFDEFYKRGVRSIGLAHIHDNLLTGSSSGENKSGLTTLGTKFIKKALKYGMIVDLAHMSSKAFTQTIKLVGKKPPFVSHSACYEICKNPRNIKDGQIKEVAKKDGVIGIFFSALYVNENKRPTVKDVANHIDHVVKIGGIDHVAIGSDFGGITKGTPKNLESIDKLQNLFKELLKRKYSEDDVKKISHDNALRVLNSYLK